MSMLTSLPLFIVVSWLWTALLAIPLWLLWTVCGLGSRYFAFLPSIWQSVSLPQMAGLLLLLAIARTIASPLKFDLRVSSRP